MRLLNQADIILISRGKRDRINYAESTAVTGMRWAPRPPTRNEGQEEKTPTLKYIYIYMCVYVCVCGKTHTPLTNTAPCPFFMSSHGREMASDKTLL